MITFYTFADKKYILRVLTRKNTTKFTVEFGPRTGGLFIFDSMNMPEEVRKDFLSQDYDRVKEAVNNYILGGETIHSCHLIKKLQVSHID